MAVAARAAASEDGGTGAGLGPGLGGGAVQGGGGSLEAGAAVVAGAAAGRRGRDSTSYSVRIETAGAGPVGVEDRAFDAPQKPTPGWFHTHQMSLFDMLVGKRNPPAAADTGTDAGTSQCQSQRVKAAYDGLVEDENVARIAAAVRACVGHQRLTKVSPFSHAPSASNGSQCVVHQMWEVSPLCKCLPVQVVEDGVSIACTGKPSVRTLRHISVACAECLLSTFSYRDASNSVPPIIGMALSGVFARVEGLQV